MGGFLARLPGHFHNDDDTHRACCTRSRPAPPPVSRDTQFALLPLIRPATSPSLLATEPSALTATRPPRPSACPLPPARPPPLTRPTAARHLSQGHPHGPPGDWQAGQQGGWQPHMQGRPPNLSIPDDARNGPPPHMPHDGRGGHGTDKSHVGTDSWLFVSIAAHASAAAYLRLARSLTRHAGGFPPNKGDMSPPPPPKRAHEHQHMHGDMMDSSGGDGPPGDASAVVLGGVWFGSGFPVGQGARGKFCGKFRILDLW